MNTPKAMSSAVCSTLLCLGVMTCPGDIEIGGTEGLPSEREKRIDGVKVRKSIKWRERDRESDIEINRDLSQSES